MKKYVNKLMYVGFVAMVLFFNACQDEFERVGNDSEETLEAGSSTAQLIMNTASNDGSFDNIIDGASCIAIQFPYTVEVAGIQVTIDNIEDLKVVEEVFDEFDDDDDILEIIFPITITLSDFTEVVLESKEALRELAAECKEGGDDDDIECIDFVYPITLFTFDINGQQSNKNIINSDRDLRLFFKEKDDNELMGIEFPITLKKYDGIEVQVNSNAELARILDAASDECDEDDDDDFNDDDFDEDGFEEFITACDWKIYKFKRNNMDQTEQYVNFEFDFDDDGEVEVTDRMDNTIEGTWSFMFSDRGALLTLQFDTLVDFNLQWMVCKINERKIKFLSDNGNKIILKRSCDDDDNDDGDNGGGDGIISVETLTNTLKECEWIIGELEVQGEDVDRLLGYEFIFGDNGMVTLGDGITTFEGTWEVGTNDNGKRTLFIEIMTETAVNLEWPLEEIYGESVVETTRIKLEDDALGYEMILQKICDDNADDGDVAEIRNIALGGLWNVALYDDEGTDETADYAGMDFGFSMFNQVEVSINDDPIAAGVWRAARDTKGNLVFYLNLGDDDPLGDLTEPWYVMEITADRIELVYEDEEVNFKTLVFEKK